MHTPAVIPWEPPVVTRLPRSAVRTACTWRPRMSAIRSYRSVRPQIQRRSLEVSDLPVLDLNGYTPTNQRQKVEFHTRVRHYLRSVAGAFATAGYTHARIASNLSGVLVGGETRLCSRRPAVRSTDIRGTQARTQSLAVRMSATWRQCFDELRNIHAALRWRGQSTASTRAPMQTKQSLIADRLLAETIGTLWVLTTHAELHHLDARHIERATRVRHQLERIQQLR